MRTMMVITQRWGRIGSMCGTTGDWTRACVVRSCSYLPCLDLGPVIGRILVKYYSATIWLNGHWP